MATRSLNKVMLIGNLTRDPELRYIPQGTAVANFGLATNRDWVNAEGERQESVEFHNIVAWGKLGELCDQLLQKGSKTYLEGRLQTRDWVGDDGKKRYKTEVVLDQMILLSNGKDWDGGGMSSAPQESDNSKEDSVPDASLDDEVDLDEILADTDFDLEDEEDEEE